MENNDTYSRRYTDVVNGLRRIAHDLVNGEDITAISHKERQSLIDAMGYIANIVDEINGRVEEWDDELDFFVIGLDNALNDICLCLARR